MVVELKIKKVVHLVAELAADAAMMLRGTFFFLKEAGFSSKLEPIFMQYIFILGRRGDIQHSPVQSRHIHEDVQLPAQPRYQPGQLLDREPQQQVPPQRLRWRDSLLLLAETCQCA